MIVFFVFLSGMVGEDDLAAQHAAMMVAFITYMVNYIYVYYLSLLSNARHSHKVHTRKVISFLFLTFSVFKCTRSTTTTLLSPFPMLPSPSPNP